MAEPYSGAPITVWDSRAAPPPREAGIVYRWEGHSERASVRSLLAYVETHAERIRRKYLSWVHQLGESRIGGERLIDHLAFGDGLSYWWMTLFVEQSPWKSPSIIDALRLLALEEILVSETPAEVRLVSANRSLHQVLQGLCRSMGISYRFERIPAEFRLRLNFRALYRALPQPVQASISLTRYLHARWPFRSAGKANWFGGDRSLFLCSYFDNLDSKAASQGVFNSYYWEGLPALMHRLGREHNWLQLFSPCVALPTPQAAMALAGRFNEHRRKQGSHAFLEAYLSWPILWRVLVRWCRLAFISSRLFGIRRAFRPPGSQFSLWPLMKRDWDDSMRGPSAVTNLLWIELFDRALRDLPRHRKGLYLCENQAWERALIHAWRKHGHGRLIAVAHSTVRFWDLRYFADPRTLASAHPHPLPQPDMTALNGKAEMDAYLSMDYPKRAIAECEALRYGYLSELPGRCLSERPEDAPMQVLILGDYMPSGTRNMMRLLEAALPMISVRITFTVKPHPNCPVEPADYPSLHLSVVVDPLARILHRFDVSYSGNLTTAAVDAHLAGLPGVVKLDPAEVNFSPLRGRHGVRFVSTPGELAEALQRADREAAFSPNHHEFFFLDPALPRWTRLLES